MPRNRSKKLRNTILLLVAAGVGFLFYAGVISPQGVGWLGRRAYYGTRGKLENLKTSSPGSGNYQSAAKCRENLKTIERAKRRAAGDGSTGGFVSQEAILEALGGSVPTCPDGGVYHVNPSLQMPTCSIGNNGTSGDPSDDHIVGRF